MTDRPKYRYLRIEADLQTLALDGIIGSEWYSNRPQGRRWNIVIKSTGTSWSYTTAQIEVFIEGAKAGYSGLAAVI